MPRKTKTETQTTPKGPRRSSSQFTPLEATALRDSRPTAITWNEKRGVYVVTVDGKKVGERASMSSARRLRAKVEKAGAFKPTKRSIAAAVKRHQKAHGQAEA